MLSLEIKLTNSGIFKKLATLMGEVGNVRIYSYKSHIRDGESMDGFSFSVLLGNGHRRKWGTENELMGVNSTFCVKVCDRAPVFLVFE